MNTRAYLYRVTFSAVETVPIGTYLIDYEDGPDDWGDRRDWSLWDTATADFLPGWAGVRLDQLCYECRRFHNAAAAYGHAESCGQAPKFIPLVEVSS